jgi:hypothetical protein
VTANWLVSQGERRATLPFVVDATPVDNLLLSATPNVEMSSQLPTLPLGVTISQLLLTSTDGSTRRSQSIGERWSVQFWFVTCGRVHLELSAWSPGLRGCGFCGGGKRRRFEILSCTGARHSEFRTRSQGPSIPIRGSVKE